ncbi:MAG: MarC family protein [Candidatus Bathyarchaeota archaeon]|nr:MarC family protein [Candidatus Bathyarchaeota archaeon]MDW8040942.1 MarC family protein [Nitrososphaerota archaeon]
MGSEKEHEGLVSSFEKQLSDWIVRRHGKVFRLALLLTIILLVFLTSFRFTVGGLKEWVQIDPAAILNISIQLFTIMNPISTIPTFLIYTGKLKDDERLKITSTTTMIVMALLLTFTLFGPFILKALDVSVTNFRFGGGILLLILAIDMLGGMSRSKTIDIRQAAVVPLATPLLVGPGTLTTLIVLSSTHAIVNVLTGGLIAAVGVYLTLRFAPLLVSAIGNNGVQAASRIMAVILAAIASQMIHSALLEWGIAKA